MKIAYSVANDRYSIGDRLDESTFHEVEKFGSLGEAQLAYLRYMNLPSETKIPDPIPIHYGPAWGVSELMRIIKWKEKERIRLELKDRKIFGCGAVVNGTIMVKSEHLTNEELHQLLREIDDANRKVQG